MGGKKSSRNVPRSLSFHAKPVSWFRMKSCINVRSSGHGKLLVRESIEELGQMSGDGD
jgi:hypothetical protein